jgi:hypothetical protein
MQNEIQLTFAKEKNVLNFTLDLLLKDPCFPMRVQTSTTGQLVDEWPREHVRHEPVGM